MFQKTAISKIGTWSWNSSPNEFQAGSSLFCEFHEARDNLSRIGISNIWMRNSAPTIFHNRKSHRKYNFEVPKAGYFKIWHHDDVIVYIRIYVALNRPEFIAFWIARNWNLFSNLSTLKSPPCLESFQLNLNFTFPH